MVDPIRLAALREEFDGAESAYSLSATDLIRLAKEKPPQPIIEGLLFKGDIMVLHGPEECYKSVFILQIAESLACGKYLLRKWAVPRALRVGVIETEMHQAMMGERLTEMFSDGNVPTGLLFMNEETLKSWRRQDLRGKIKLIQEWVKDEAIDVLVIDTANDFFRGALSPSDERHVGELFDLLRNLALKGVVLVRHDHKKREFDAEGFSAFLKLPAFARQD